MLAGKRNRTVVFPACGEQTDRFPSRSRALRLKGVRRLNLNLNLELPRTRCHGRFSKSKMPKAASVPFHVTFTVIMVRRLSICISRAHALVRIERPGSQSLRFVVSRVGRSERPFVRAAESVAPAARVLVMRFASESALRGGNATGNQ